MIYCLRQQFRVILIYALSGLLSGGAFLILGMFIGFYPALPERLQRTIFDSQIKNQTMTEVEVQNYVRALLEIERLRQRAYADVKQHNGHVPPVECHRPQRLSNLSDRIRDITMNYCDQAVEIVKMHDLSIARFNFITHAMQVDSALAKRIQMNLFCTVSGDCTTRLMQTKTVSQH